MRNDIDSSPIIKKCERTGELHDFLYAYEKELPQFESSKMQLTRAHRVDPDYLYRKELYSPSSSDILNCEG